MLGSAKAQNWAAHIWCWPTPVTMMARPWVASVRDLSTYWGSRPSVCRINMGGCSLRRASTRRSQSMWTLDSTKRKQLPEHLLDVADNGGGGPDVLVYFRRVDVDVDYLGVGGEVLDPAGNPVVESHAQGNEQVGFVDGKAGVGPTVHAGHPHVQIVVGGE